MGKGGGLVEVWWMKVVLKDGGVDVGESSGEMWRCGHGSRMELWWGKGSVKADVSGIGAVRQKAKRQSRGDCRRSR